MSENGQKVSTNLWDREETTNMNFGSILGKAKERFTAPGLVLYRNERRYISVIILSQEGQETWSRCIHRSSEKAAGIQSPCLLQLQPSDQGGSSVECSRREPMPAKAPGSQSHQADRVYTGDLPTQDHSFNTGKNKFSPNS